MKWLCIMALNVHATIKNKRLNSNMIFKELIIALSKIDEQLREQSIRAVNTSLTLRNWFFGFYILKFEQNRKDRAGYTKYG